MVLIAAGTLMSSQLQPAVASTGLAVTTSASGGPLQPAVDARLDAIGIPGTWILRESRAGNLCEAKVDFAAPQRSEPPFEGSVSVRSPCVDPGSGVWQAVLDGDKPTLGWAVSYDKSRVIYSTTKVQAARADGTVKASGVIRAAPRQAPDQLRQVGTFDAKASLSSASPR